MSLLLNVCDAAPTDSNAVVSARTTAMSWTCEVEMCCAEYHDSCTVCRKALCPAHADLGNHPCFNQNYNDDVTTNDFPLDRECAQRTSILNELYDIETILTEAIILVAGKLVKLAAFHYCDDNPFQLVNGMDGNGKHRRSYIDLDEQYLLYRYEYPSALVLLFHSTRRC